MMGSLAEDLEAAGYEFSSGWEMKDSGLRYVAAVPILLRWLPLTECAREREGIVRALTVPWAKSDEVLDAMVKEFQAQPVPGNAHEDGLRWTVGNAIDALWNDTRFDECAALARDRQYGRAREMIVYGMRKSKRPEAGHILVGLLDDPDVNGHAVSALRRVKDPNARPGLERMTQDSRAWVRRDAKQALVNLGPELADAPSDSTGVVRELLCTSWGAGDRRAVESLVDLESLVLEGTSIEDLTPLSGLVRLRELDLQETEVVDLTPLAGMVELRSLDLSGSKVADLAPVSGLTGLVHLNVGDTLIETLTPIRGLVNLEVLHVGDNQIEEISAISGLIKLTDLDLSDTYFHDLGPLADLVMLEALNVSTVPVKDLAPLTGLVSLRRLDISETEVVNLTPLTGLVNLRHLHLGEAQRPRVSVLSDLTNLTITWA